MAHGIPESLLPLAVPVGDLVPYGKNPRRGDVALIRRSLERDGQYRPIVARKGSGEILAGNHTYAAAVELGWSHIAVGWVECDDAKARRIVLNDNATADAASYDDRELLELLEEANADGGLDGTGFVVDELDAMRAGFGGAPVALTDVDDAPPAPAREDAVSREGDVWHLGPHRLLCGDATDGAAVALMLDGDQPDVVWTDPPYGVNYVGGTDEALTILNDDSAALPAMLLGAYETIAAVCRPGAPVYVAHADSERLIFEGAMRQAGLIFRQNLVWVKNALVMGRSDYHYRHEPVLEAEVPGDEPLTHEPLLYGFVPGDGRLGRGGPNWHGDNKSSTVFEVPKPKRSGEHPTMKPVELIEAMLRNSLRPGGLVLDLFAGSGSTLITAHHMKARAAVVELDPRYADVICRRWQEHTGVVPIRDGKPVDFVSLAA